MRQYPDAIMVGEQLVRCPVLRSVTYCSTNVFHSVGFLPNPNSKGAACAAILAPDEITSPATRDIRRSDHPL
jgi:hypothetical protein